MEIIFGIVGAIIGTLVTALLMQNRHHKVAAQVSTLEAQANALKTQVEQAKQQTEVTKAEYAQRLKEQKEEAEQHHAEAMNAQKAQFDETMAKVAAQMKEATDEMLKQRQKEFAESSSTNLGQIVNPLRETIDKMKQAMNDSTLKQTALGSEMKVSIENMIQQSKAAKQSADELRDTLKHKSKVQGDWGETVLAELLTSQGLTQGVHYDLQPYIRDEQGNIVRSESNSMMRPDVILHLDEERDVIIDSKVSLTAFMDYVNAETDEQQQQFLKAHIESIQSHVKELSEKDYSSYIQPPKAKMDYVIMFVPHTGALWTALNAQTDLWRKAMEKNVFIADEQTLFAALRIIHLTWRQIVQTKNHEEVYKLANEILDRVGQLWKHYATLGDALSKAQKAYEAANLKLQPKGQSILTTCSKLQKLGAKQNGKNPLPTIDDTDIDIISELPADTL